MKKFNTIIFDMDGTLLNTIEDIADSVNYILKKYGYSLRTYEEIRNFVGNGSERLMELALPGGRNNPDFEKHLNEYKHYYLKNNNNKTSPYEGIFELLEELTRRNYKIAIVSNKNDDNIKDLNRTYFSGYIKTAVGESKDVMRKPAPDMVYNALKELNSGIENSVYIGDSEVDIDTAKNAGIPCVSVCWGFRDKEFLSGHGAKYLIDKPHELLEFLGEEVTAEGTTI
jgi:phosphoglycolate phosphatase